MKTLIIFSHPNLENSIANKTIINTLKKENNTNIKIHHLETLYPDYKIDVEFEQKALLEADIIIFQHPMLWYSVPPMLKLWMDEVLAYGFAYAKGGDKLKGKKLIHSFTTAGKSEDYSSKGYNNYDISTFLFPIKQTSNLIQMEYQDPIYIHGCNPYVNTELEAQAIDHAQKLLQKINKLEKL